MSETHSEKRPGTAEYREQLIYRYIRALDSNDPDFVDFVLEAAEEDPELDQLISEVNQALHDEMGLGPLAAEASIVHDLLRRHLPSGFSQPQHEAPPLTVGEVATRMLNDRRLTLIDREGCRSLQGSQEPVPGQLSRQTVIDLAARLEPANPLTERGWNAFRDAAIMAFMGRGRQQAHLAAARQARERYARNQPIVHAISETAGTPVSTRDTGEAAARAYRDAGLAIQRAAPGIAPLNDIIGAHPIRLAEIPGLNYCRAAEYLAAETGQTIDVLADQPGDLAGFLYCQLHDGILYGCILTKRDDPIVRRRFSAAHELGHYILHFLPLLERGRGDIGDRLVFWEGLTYAGDDGGTELPSGRLAAATDGTSQTSGALPMGDPEEIEANQFAAEVLIPAAACRLAVERERGRIRDRSSLVRRLASEFLVSQQAMRRRLDTLGLANE